VVDETPVEGHTPHLVQPRFVHPHRELHHLLSTVEPIVEYSAGSITPIKHRDAHFNFNQSLPRRASFLNSSLDPLIFLEAISSE
jgi:hypothetical protein